ncbi:MAG: hypothetical protein IPQ08_09205 [Chitinophagaceae bacterium]|nr:hypothetical protein [Chitinophagaceae bacterium]
MKFLIPLIMSTLIFMASLVYVIVARFHVEITHLEIALIAFVISGILMMGFLVALVIKILKEE